MILELANLGDIGGHFHHLGNVSLGIVANRRGIDQYVDRLTGVARHYHFRLVGLAVFKRPRHWAVAADTLPTAINLEAVLTGTFPESFLEFTIDGGEVKVAILDSDIARYFIKELLITHLAAVQFFL